MPKSKAHCWTVDSLLLQLEGLWARYKALKRLEDYHVLRADCAALQRHFGIWADGQAPEARPIAVASLGRHNKTSSASVGCWPSRVDTYSDLYIAGVWNIARVARLLLFALTLRISDGLGETGAHMRMMCSTNAIVEDILASVPYHLAENLYEFLDSPTDGITEPGKTLGGLLIMYPLYLTSTVPFVGEPIKSYLRDSLSWIGSNMGIGHAERLAKVNEGPEINSRTSAKSSCSSSPSMSTRNPS